MNRNLIIGIVVVVLVAVGGWFFLREEVMESDEDGAMEQIATPSDTSLTPSGSVTESTDSSVVEGTAKEFTVTGSNFKFDLPEIRVKAGDTVKITFKNAAGFHDLVIDEFDVKTKQANGPVEEVVTFVADKAGTYEFYCSVGQHRQMGMKGNFIVE